MTVPTTTNKEIALGNGVATVYPFTFGTLPSGDLVVTQFDLNDLPIAQVEGVDYTVVGKGSEDGGSIVFAVAPLSGYTVLIQRLLATTQPDDLKNQGSFYPRTVERMFDRRSMVDQQLSEQLDRTLTLPAQVQGVSTELPVPQSNNLIGWDEAAQAMRNFTVADIGTTLAFSNFLGDRFTATAGQTVFTLTAAPGSINNLDVSIDGVAQVSVDDYTLSGSTLTLTSPTTGGERVFARYGTALPTGITLPSAIMYTPPSTGVPNTLLAFLDSLWSTAVGAGAALIRYTPPSTSVVGTITSFLDSLWSTGTNAGAKLIRWISSGTGAVARTVEDKLRERVSVKDFGAKGDTTTDDSAAFLAALAASDIVYVPPGTYNVKLIDVPSNKKLVGAGKTSSVLRPLTSCAYVVNLGASAEARDLWINGNNVATNGVQIGGSYAKAFECHAQYCVAGYYNVNYDAWELVGNSSDNCTYSFYNANRGINVVIDRHQSRGPDVYALYFTYSTQQPQGIRVKNGLFIGNQYGVWFQKDAFNVEINAIIDLCAHNGITLADVAPSTSTDYVIDCPFIGALDFGILVNPGHSHITIQNCDVPNSFNGIRFLATTTKRTTGVTIRDVSFGNNSNIALVLDSVYGCHVTDCTFGPVGGAFDIACSTTYTTTANSKLLIDNCTFLKGSASVDTTNTRVRNCVGPVWAADGNATIAAAGTSVVVTHGMTRTPTQVRVTPQANVGSVWVSAIGATTFTINCSTAAAGATLVSWQATAD